MNYVLGNWVFDQTDPEVLEVTRGNEWDHEQDWIAFKMWLRIEMYVFMGAIASGMVYMFVRSFVRTAFDMTDEHDCFSERTDHLEANQIAISMFEAYFSPFFATIILKFDSGYEITDQIKWCVNIFFWGQIVQTFGFLFWNFTIPF